MAKCNAHQIRLKQTARGDYANAALSAAACIPIVGSLWTTAKLVNKGSQVVDTVVDGAKVIDNLVDSSKIVDKVNDAGKAVDNISDVSKGIDAAKQTSKVTSEVIEGGSNTINTLTDAQKSRLNSLENTINDHLTEGDFSGTLRDLQGNPVPNGKGGYFDHLGEMKDSFAALNKIKKGLEGFEKS